MTVRRSPRLVSSLSRAGLGTAFAVAPSTASFALTWDSVPRPKVAHLSTCKAVSSGWLCLVRAVGLDDNRERPFPPLFIRDSDHGGFLHVGKLHDQLLDLQRRYPFSAAPILPACPRWPLVNPDMLPTRVKPGKSHQIVAKETAHPRPSDQARSVDGSLPARRRGGCMREAALTA